MPLPFLRLEEVGRAAGSKVSGYDGLSRNETMFCGGISPSGPTKAYYCAAFWRLLCMGTPDCGHRVGRVLNTSWNEGSSHMVYVTCRLGW